MITIAGISISMVWIWLIIAIIFIIIEAITVGLTTIWFAAGALVGLLLAFFKVPVMAQIIIFLIVSLVLLGTTRKVFVNKLKTGSQKTNVDALVGEEAVVLEDITPFNTGLVKVKGQNWTAVAYDKDATIKAGETVKIKAIEGVKLIVK
ncbi:MAG: NfeD family protein [Clostridiales bacterium]|jgi:membrane protein implicated in regulation of membrane protease activity|nr:NfeD family protein [Clostridiales bacterium]